MNKKNLMDAFGEIDERFFENAEKKDLQYYEESAPQAPAFVSGKQRKMSKKPFFAAGAAACALAAAVCIPMIMKSMGTLPYSGETTSDTDETLDLTEAADTSEVYTTEEVTEALLTLPYDQDFEQEFYVDQEDFLNAEELYHVEKKEIDIDKLNKYGKIDALYLSIFYGDLTYLDGSSFYYSSIMRAPLESWEPEPAEEPAESAVLYRYDFDTEENTVVFEEKPNSEEYGLMLKIAGIDGEWLYYYHLEHRYQFDEGSAELWRFNLSDGRKEKIVELGSTIYYFVHPFIKSGKYLYFYFTEEPNYCSYIYRYDTEKEKAEILKEGVEYLHSSRCLFPYKNGVIYEKAGGNFYYYQNNGEEELLFNEEDIFDRSLYFGGSILFNTLGEDKIVYYYLRDDKNIAVDTFGILDDNFERQDLMTTKYIIGTGYNTDKSELMLISLSLQDDLVIYDLENNRFSVLDLPEGTKGNDGSAGVFRIEYEGKEDEINLIVFDFDKNRSDDEKYDWVTLYTIKRKPEVSENKPQAFTKDFDGIVMTVTTDKSNYKSDELIYVEAAVKNTTNEKIRLFVPVLGPNSHREIDTRISRNNGSLIDIDTFMKCFADAVDIVTIDPGEEYIQSMRFETYTGSSRKLAETGLYSGESTITLISDPTSAGSDSNYTHYSLDFSLTLE